MIVNKCISLSPSYTPTPSLGSSSKYISPPESLGSCLCQLLLLPGPSLGPLIRAGSTLPCFLLWLPSLSRAGLGGLPCQPVPMSEILGLRYCPLIFVARREDWAASGEGLRGKSPVRIILSLPAGVECVEPAAPSWRSNPVRPSIMQLHCCSEKQSSFFYSLVGVTGRYWDLY